MVFYFVREVTTVPALCKGRRPRLLSDERVKGIFIDSFYVFVLALVRKSDASIGTP